MTAPRIAFPTSSPRARKRRGAARIVSLVLGTLLLLAGIPLMAAGGLLLWTHGVHRSDGFVTSPEDRFTTSASALVSDRIDLRAGADWLPVHAAVGDARLEVTLRGDDPVFVGVARSADVEVYLRGVDRAAVEDLGFGAPVREADPRPGSRSPARPADQDFWIAHASGTGVQRITWPATDGDWMFVIMRADGAAGIDVQGRIGARFPALGTVAWAVLFIGLGLTVVGGLVIAAGARRGA